MAASTGLRQVDHSALRVNQAFIIGLNILAFVLNAPLIAAFVAVVMLVGTVWTEAGLFKAVYRLWLKPAGIVRPDVKTDNPEPHRFAQGFGGVVLAIGVLLLTLGIGAGWAVVWLVVALAALNLFAGVCVGCIVYYQLNRLGVPGFDVAPIAR